MKRIIAIILLMCIFALSGCNTASPDTNEASDNNETITNETTNIPNKDIPQGSIEEKHFVLESNGYKLNAVYTYIDDGNAHPAVLLIAGSGPSDYDETLGTLKPFKDIANGLAKEGINSLRVDKRTFSYAANFDIKCGIEEEYLDDCNTAIEYLKSQNISGLYLLGHSLGGQITTELAASIEGIDGMILFNSSARHLADIACDQYSVLDSVKSDRSQVGL